jgi:hypothetical protein
MNMTPEEFNNLGTTIQAEAIWELGTPIGERDQQTLRYVLYKLEDFVVEVCFHKVHNFILYIRGMQGAEVLQPASILQAC